MGKLCVFYMCQVRYKIWNYTVMLFTKLNLGSGKNYLSEGGWLNVDINGDFKPDLIADMATLTFPPESFIEVLVKDCLDHVNPAEAKQLLRRIYSWLKADGTLTVHTPNLAHLAKLIYRDADPKVTHEAVRWLYGSDGEGTSAYWSNVIRWRYSPKSLQRVLVNVGYKILSLKYDCYDFAFSVVAVKQKC